MEVPRDRLGVVVAATAEQPKTTVYLTHNLAPGTSLATAAYKASRCVEIRPNVVTAAFNWLKANSSCFADTAAPDTTADENSLAPSSFYVSNTGSAATGSADAASAEQRLHRRSRKVV